MSIGRYALLAGANYYPEGWGDFRGSFATIEQAKRHAGEMAESEAGVARSQRRVQWVEIGDLETGELALRGRVPYEDTTGKIEWFL